MLDSLIGSRTARFPLGTFAVNTAERCCWACSTVWRSRRALVLVRRRDARLLYDFLYVDAADAPPGRGRRDGPRDRQTFCSAWRPDWSAALGVRSASACERCSTPRLSQARSYGLCAVLLARATSSGERASPAPSPEMAPEAELEEAHLGVTINEVRMSKSEGNRICVHGERGRDTLQAARGTRRGVGVPEAIETGLTVDPAGALSLKKGEVMREPVPDAVSRAALKGNLSPASARVDTTLSL